MVKNVLLLAMVFAVSALQARGDQGMLDPLAKSTTRIAPGFVLSIGVSIDGMDENELCGFFTLDEEAHLTMTVGSQPLERFSLNGMTVAQARQRIVEVLQPFFVDTPEVRIGISRMPRMQIVVSGATYRIGPLSLPVGSRLSDALAETSFQPGADISHVQIVRLDRGGTRVKLIADFAKSLQGSGDEKFDNPLLHDGDQVTLVRSPVPVVTQSVAVLGEVQRPGAFLYNSGMTVRDALTAANGMLPSADPERVLIRRVRDNTYMTVNGARALENIPTENLVLRPDDTLFVTTRDLGRRYAIVGEVPAPHTFDYKKPVPLSQAIVDAGGFKPDADRRNVLLIRNMLQDPSKAQSVVIDYDRIARGAQPDIMLEPGDMVQIPQKKKQPLPLLEIGAFLLRLFVL